MKGDPVFLPASARRLITRCFPAACAVASAVSAHAVYVGSYQGTPPDGLFYGNVRVLYKDGNSTVTGSGVLLAPKLDAKGTGAWLYVLTADHVVRGRNPGDIKIGFGQGSSVNSRVALIDNVALGPKYGNTNDIVDLAMVNVYVANWSGPGGLQSLYPFDPASLGTAGQGSIYMAGYGATGKIDNGKPGFVDVVKNPDMKWDIGYNKGYTSIAKEVTTYVKRTNTTYRFLGDSAPLRFTRGGLFGNGWPPLYSDSYVMPGDSGGPTYQVDGNGTWNLVGIHSFGAYNTAAGTVAGGSMFTDVDVGSYTKWINDTYNSMPTPEPASMAALGIGALALLGRRRLRKR